MAALLQPGDTILGLDLAHGGHLTLGMRFNFSGKLYDVADRPGRHADRRSPGWLLVAVGASLVPFLGAALNLAAFAPGRLPPDAAARRAPRRHLDALAAVALTRALDGEAEERLREHAADARR